MRVLALMKKFSIQAAIYKIKNRKKNVLEIMNKNKEKEEENK